MEKEFVYKNPIGADVIKNIRDPFIILEGDIYYLTGTIPPYWDGKSEGVKLWKSSDLLNWEEIGFILHRSVAVITKLRKPHLPAMRRLVRSRMALIGEMAVAYVLVRIESQPVVIFGFAPSVLSPHFLSPPVVCFLVLLGSVWCCWFCLVLSVFRAKEKPGASFSSRLMSSCPAVHQRRWEIINWLGGVQLGCVPMLLFCRRSGSHPLAWRIIIIAHKISV